MKETDKKQKRDTDREQIDKIHERREYAEVLCKIKGGGKLGQYPKNKTRKNDCEIFI